MQRYHTITKEEEFGDPRTETGDPHYTFQPYQECKDFQSAVRGQHLVGQWDVDTVQSGAGGPKEAFRQHLKLWQDYLTQQHTLSFFANNSRRTMGPGHLEFPLVWFQPEVKEKGPSGFRLDFIPLGKRPRWWRRPSSSSQGANPTGRCAPGTNGRAANGAPGPGSPGLALSPRTSRGSFSSFGSTTSMGESLTDADAQAMKYLDISFSEDTGQPTQTPPIPL